MLSLLESEGAVHGIERLNQAYIGGGAVSKPEGKTEREEFAALEKQVTELRKVLAEIADLYHRLDSLQKEARLLVATAFKEKT